jgi:hypothetical protein
MSSLTAEGTGARTDESCVFGIIQTQIRTLIIHSIAHHDIYVYVYVFIIFTIVYYLYV